MAIAVYRPNVEAVFHAGEPEEDQFMKKPQLGRFAISTKNGIASVGFSLLICIRS
jgi:hypothetical protein